MKKKFFLFLVIFFFLPFSLYGGKENNYFYLFKWTLLQMKVDASQISELPKIIEMEQKNFHDFLKMNFPYLLKQTELKEIVAIYRPKKKEIYIIKDAHFCYLVHEFVHFIQFEIKKPSLKNSLTEKERKRLEQEAKLIERRCFFLLD